MVLAAPVTLLILPVFDTTAAILRRKLTGRSICTTDRGHIHHCLLRGGYSTWMVLLLISGFSVLAAGGVLASRSFDCEWIALLTGGAVVAILISTRLFGFAEAMLLKQWLLSLSAFLLQRLPAGQARQTQVRLQGNAEWQRLWSTLTAEAVRLNLQHVRLDINVPALHEGYHARWDRSEEAGEVPNLWRVEIPLAAQGLTLGRLEVSGQQDEEPAWRKIAAVTRVVEANEETIILGNRTPGQERPARSNVPRPGPAVPTLTGGTPLPSPQTCL